MIIKNVTDGQTYFAEADTVTFSEEGVLIFYNGFESPNPLVGVTTVFSDNGAIVYIHTVE